MIYASNSSRKVCFSILKENKYLRRAELAIALPTYGVTYLDFKPFGNAKLITDGMY